MAAPAKTRKPVHKSRKASTTPARSAKTAPRSTGAKKAVRKAGGARSSHKGSAESATAGEREVTIDRRRAQTPAAGGAAVPAAPKLERRKKVNRRRQIDPTTCERDYSEDEVEFMNAIDEYKRKSGRMFPTCSEVLEVVRGLGYVKLTASAAAIHQADAGALATPVESESEIPQAPGELASIGN